MSVIVPVRASSIPTMLLLEPIQARQLWSEWRELSDINAFDDAALAHLPLLAERLLIWTAGDNQAGKFLGICKRAWTQNQLQYRDAATLWTLLSQCGAAPIALCGDVALALRYWEEKAVRPIASIEILIRRSHAAMATNALLAAGWLLEPSMPQPMGRVLDQFEGLWFYSHSNSSFHLRWRLPKVSPELALKSEEEPEVQSVDIVGVTASQLAPEELLVQVLTRPEDFIVPWQCDAIVVLRNSDVDRSRVHRLARFYPSIADRVAFLRESFGTDISYTGLPIQPMRRRNRFDRWRTDYRQVAWQDGTPRTARGFLRYFITRTIRHTPDPTALTVIDASRNSGRVRVTEYRRFKTLFFFLAMRDIRVRYRQTWRGILWALLQPILPMLLFAAIFARAVRPELSRGPYWLFVLVGLAPWNFFSNSVNYAAATFVSNANLLSKVYFPRAILPAAAVGACLIDLCVSSTSIAILTWIMGYPPTLHFVAIPFAFIAITLVAGVFGLAAASINVLYRDAKPLVTFLVQVAMYAAPVLYPLQMLPTNWRWVLWLNPMTGVVETFRFALLTSPFDWRGSAISLSSLFGIAILTILLFRQVETDIAERI